jgi:hypothetical protein
MARAQPFALDIAIVYLIVIAIKIGSHSQSHSKYQTMANAMTLAIAI